MTKLNNCSKARNAQSFRAKKVQAKNFQMLESQVKEMDEFFMELVGDLQERVHRIEHPAPSKTRFMNMSAEELNTFCLSQISESLPVKSLNHAETN